MNHAPGAAAPPAATGPAGPAALRRPLFGIRFNNEAADDLARRIATEPVPAGHGPRLVVTANIDHVVQLAERPDFRRAYDGAWAATADGWPVVAYARFAGGYAHGRVTGADLFPLIAGQLGAEHRIFCLASGEATAVALAERLEREGVPPVLTEVVVPPFGFEEDAAYSEALARRIRAFGTTHLFLGVGAPKSEIWVDRHRAALGDLYACCFGASLNFYAGTRRRAPRAMQRLGLEWLWRMMGEPRRLIARYGLGAPRYLWLVLRDLLRGGRA
ncbi:MAG: WecB/TagA/CpsF family glycosyltransferase [Sphingomonas fennica]